MPAKFPLSLPSSTFDSHQTAKDEIIALAQYLYDSATSVLRFGYVRSESVDNSAAIRSAIASIDPAEGGLVSLPPGPAGFDGLIEVPESVTFLGAGKDATRLHCLSAGARLQFGGLEVTGGRRGLAGMLQVNGNDVATNPVLFALSANNTVIDIKATSSPGTAMRFLNVQNSRYLGIEALLSAVGLEFDGAPKNVEVSGVTNDNDLGIWLHADTPHPAGGALKEPARIYVRDLLCETSNPRATGVRINSGVELFWVRGAINVPANGVGIVVEQLDPLGIKSMVGEISLDGTQIAGSGGATAIRIKTAHTVTMHGLAKIAGCGTLFDIQDGGARVFRDPTVLIGAPTGQRLVTSGSAAGRSEGQVVCLNGAYRLQTTADTASTDATTLVGIPELTLYGPPPRSSWELELELLVDGASGTSGDLDLQWSALPAGATIVWTTDGEDINLVRRVTRCTGSAPTTPARFGTDGSTVEKVVRVTGRLTLDATAADSVYPRFRQVSLDKKTPTKVRAGSTAKYTRVS